jgi:oligoribonuclease
MGSMVWVDIETTGLNPSEDIILEIGLVITDFEGRVKDTWRSLVYEGDWAYGIEAMSDLVKVMHQKSGLLDEFMDTAMEDRCDLTRVSEMAIEWLGEHGLKAGEHPMCGSSVHFDRRFLEYWGSDLVDWFHYRNVDVSTLKTICEMVNPPVAKNIPEKTGTHRPITDLDSSINEYRFYLDNFLHVWI